MSTSSNKSDKDNITENMRNFVISVIVLTIFVVIYITIGGLVLYATKIAQSNILPTNINCEPYISIAPRITAILINIFNAVSPETNKEESQKIEFPYDDTNSANIILEILKNIKESPNSFGLTNYFVSIIDDLICFNYSNINFILGLMNKIVPETAILILGPIIMHFMFFILLVVGYFYSMYLWFVKMSWFFKTRSPLSKDPNAWENIEFLFNPIGYCFALFLVFLFFILFFVVGTWSLVLLSLFSVLWTMFSILSYKGVMNDKKVDVITIIKKVFKYHKVTVMTILTILIILTALSTVGPIAGLVCLLCALSFYFNIISSTIYKGVIPTNLSPLTSYEQARKTCNINQSAGGKILSGKKLLNEIKKISSKITGK